MSVAEGARSVNAVTRFLRPRSIAVIGVSTRAGSAGQIILQCLKVNRFAGDVYLVGRTDELIDGRRVLKSADELPAGVDLAVFTLPAAAARQAMEACARRKVGTALVFAAGFAETGDHATQDAVAATARAAGLAVVGPNCLGVTNNVDGLMLHMLYAQEASHGITDGVAIIGQSGGLLGHFQRACDGRGIPLSYVISTGNEAGLDTTDFLAFLIDDPSTRVIVAYCEEFRRPQRFLAALRRARAANNPGVLILVGRSVKARQAAQSHTGALVSDFAIVNTEVEDARAVKAFADGMAHSPRPNVMVALFDTWPLTEDVEAVVKESPAVFSRSSDRMLRAIAHYTRYGRNLARPRSTIASLPIPGLPKL